MPFSLQLRHTKSKRTSGQDLRLQAPEIHALLDSKEFLTFVDVVRCVPIPARRSQSCCVGTSTAKCMLRMLARKTLQSWRKFIMMLHHVILSLCIILQKSRCAGM